MITRRGLFGLLAAAVLDPERLLWVPGKKLISIPKVSKLEEFSLCFSGLHIFASETFPRNEIWIVNIPEFKRYIDKYHIGVHRNE